MSSEPSPSPINQEELMKNVGKHLNLIKNKTKTDPKIILGILAGGLVLTLLGWFDKYITCLITLKLSIFDTYYKKNITYLLSKALKSDQHRQYIQTY
jgi:hypothetical protein